MTLIHKRRVTILPAGAPVYSFRRSDAAAMLEVVRVYYDMPAHYLSQRSRARCLVEPRQTAMYMLTLIEDLYMHEIADMCGYTDHAIVVHSRNVVEQRIRFYRDWEQRIRTINYNAAMISGRTMINNYEYIYKT